MTNLSKLKREYLNSKLELLRNNLDDESLKVIINELELELLKKKFGLVWEEHQEEVDEQLLTKIPIFKEVKSKEFVSKKEDGFNFILEGDNLHSLKLLEKTHKKSVDVIYIDPPYNTGAKDWKYNNDYVDSNDSFRHSKWLSMMYNRLIIAKKLLKDEGVLICAIDENEQATLTLLLEEIFGYNYDIDCITIVHNPRGVQGNNFSYTHEYALFVYPKGNVVVGDRELEETEITSSPLRNWGTESLRTDAKNCFYPIYIKDNEIIGFGDVLDDEIHPSGRNEVLEDGIIAVYPIDNKGIERKWRYANSTVPSIKNDLLIKETKGTYDIRLQKKYGSYKTVWLNKKFDANEYGSQLISSMVPKNDFDFPKSLYNVYECLLTVTKNNPNAIILDFFAGSGTTAHAVSLLNKEDNGNRKFILATNNAIGDKKEKKFKKDVGPIEENKNILEEWEEKYGIASSITYPRVKAINDGFIHSKIFKETLFEKKLNMTQFRKSEEILEKIENLKEEFSDKFDDFKVVFEDNMIKLLGIYNKNEEIPGILFNLKYYKTGFVDKTDDGTVSFEMLSYISELIQLQYHIDITDESIKLILSEEELDSLSEDSLRNCKIIFMPSDVFLTSAQEDLFNKLEITLINIPKYYFAEELKELDEI